MINDMMQYHNIENMTGRFQEHMHFFPYSEKLLDFFFPCTASSLGNTVNLNAF